MKTINMSRTPDEIALSYLKTQFNAHENIIDVKNKFYTAQPHFGKKDTPLKGLFCQEVTLKDFILTYRDYSPTNHNGKLKESYYVVLYHIEPIK